MEVIIINSFDNFPTQTGVSTPFITGFLKHNNINCRQLDLNIEVWNKLLSKETITKLNYTNRDYSFAKKHNIPVISETEFNRIKVSLEETVVNAKSIYRNSNLFYDIEKLSWANSVIQDFQNLYFYHTGFLIKRMKTIWSTNEKLHFSFSKMNSFANDKIANPFIDIYSEIVRTEIKIPPKLFLIEAMFPWQMPQIVTLNFLLKEIFPETHINFSGYGFDQLTFARVLDKIDVSNFIKLGFDSIFSVRNDNALHAFVKSLLSNKSILETSSLAIPHNNEIILNEPFKEQYADELISPDYSDINFDKYLSPLPVVTDKYSNRCFWHQCKYCAINYYKGKNTKLKDKVFIDRIIELAKKYSIKHLFLLDEGATANEGLKIAKLIAQSKIKLIWSIRTRIDNELSLSILLEMYKAGCRELWIGLEHVNVSMLKKMNKTDNSKLYVQEVNRIIRICSTIGIGLHFCLLFDFPGEKKIHRKQILDFFESNVEYFKKIPVFISFNEFLLSPNSYVYQNPDEYNLTIFDNDNDLFCMDDVPFLRKNISENIRKLELEDINNIIAEITNLLSPIKEYQNLWHNITDTCHEMLFKEYYQSYNPFFVKKDYCIFLEDNDFIKDNWITIEHLLNDNFLGTNLNEGFTYVRPATHTWENVNNKENEIMHLIVKNSKYDIIGGLFCIPINLATIKNSCDLGWFYIDKRLSNFKKIKIVDDIFERVHRLLKLLGYKEIITEMGTTDGAKLLEKRHGYEHRPLIDKQNNWIKKL